MNAPRLHRGRLLVVVNDPDFLISHRLPVLEGARAAGWDVHTATGAGAGAQWLKALGFPHHPVPIDRGGLNPVRDARTCLALWRLFRRLQPDLVHTVTVKPVIWGGIAARLARVPGRLSAIPGLGYVALAKGVRGRLLRALVRPFYRVGLGGPNNRILFQNVSDRAFVAGMGVTLAGRDELIPGSGVALDEFTATPEPAGPPVVLMGARVLYSKGAAEFVEAARRLRAEGTDARFLLAGSTDSENPDSVPEAVLARWRADAAIRFLGHRTDMAQLMANAHIVALPSHAEGFPRVLIEAAASGRPVVTCDAPGCRDAVEDGRTGLLVPVGDVDALTAALRRLIADAGLRRRMGAAGRRMAEQRFDVDRVVSAHLAIYDRLSAAELPGVDVRVPLGAS